jgi:site-specific DNA recombinase
MQLEGPKPLGTPAAIYARISPRPKKPGRRAVESFSIEEQQNVCREACKRFGWPVRYVLVDRLESAKDLDRPSLQKLLDHVEAGRIGVVVVWKLDRMWRSLRDTVNLFEFFTESGVAFHSCTEPFDNTSSFGRFVFRNVASAAELERELIRERTQMAFHWRARQGLWIGRAPPYGYSRDAEGHLTIEPDEASVARQIFGLYMRLKSMEAVVEDLQRRGIACRKGVSWSQNRIQTILTNPIYAGRMAIAGVEHARPKLAIVTPFAFDECAKLRARGKSRRSKRADDHVERAIASVFADYSRILRDMESAGEIAGEDALGDVLSKIKEDQ